jgi:hypothetical protein
MSRDELIVLVGEQAERIAAQDRQITALATRIAGMDGLRGVGGEAGPGRASAVAELGEFLQSAVHGRPAG